MKKTKKVTLKVKKEWSPHKYLVAAARKVWRWSPARTAVINRAQTGYATWKCESCQKEVGKVDVLSRRGARKQKIDGAADHIAPVGKQPKTWDGYPDFYRRLFCEEANYQFLCTQCHAVKTKAEGTERRKAAQKA